MGELGALFNPGMRHELEERRSRAERREEEGNARDGDLRIDLDSGVAVINAQDEDDAHENDTGDTVRNGPGQPRAGGPQVDGAQAGGAQAGAAEQAADERLDDEQAPAPVRPRGKRAMSASRR